MDHNTDSETIIISSLYNKITLYTSRRQDYTRKLAIYKL